MAAAQVFHDGNDDIPAGIDGPAERVLVVGAGLSGLTVANALGHAGVECVVLEARDRIGGRTHTVDLAGTPVDLGGSWIHHPIGNPLRTFADQAGVSCGDGDVLPTLTAYDVGDGRWLTPDELAASLDVQFDAFPDAVEQLRGALGSDASSADGVKAFVANRGGDSGTSRRDLQALRAIIEADASAGWERQSLQWLGHEMEYGGDFFGDLPRGGYARLVEAMAGGVDVRLDSVVDDVAVEDDGVRLTTSDGETLTGSHAVVTVPLGVLKQGRPRFHPALPAERQAATDRVGFGRYEKVVLAFDRAFWRDEGFSHLMLFPADADDPTVWMFDADAFGDGPVLAFHLFATNAEKVLGDATGDGVAWALGLLGAALGRPCPEPVGAIVTSWATDRFAGGAYSHLPVGADPADLDLLGEPVAGRLLFAGEHTQSARPGFADGAMSSGVREAKRLLRRPAVELGPLAR
ncbi:MAG TPA: NAD(P)/FAD-dependent oxidoreductase [Nocardioidaceae bacterium]|nr:NAD(P)/FAD-dependent oxidoreductase [Nocardioidaceae bacterium]